MSNEVQNKYYVLEVMIDPPMLLAKEYVYFYANISSKDQVDKVLEILNMKEFDVILPFVFEKDSLSEYREEDFTNDYNNSKLKINLKIDENNTLKCFFASESEEMIKWTEAKLPLVEEILKGK